MRRTRLAITAIVGMALWAGATGAAHAAAPAVPAAPVAYSVTPELIAAAREEGTVAFYTATDVQVAEALATKFEETYPGITVQVERSGSERVFQRLNQEYSARIYNADIIETSDAVHFLLLKRNDWLQAAVPEDVANLWPAEKRDPDGFYAAYRADLSVIAYNTNLVSPEDAPTSFAELLEPKWNGKLVKAHPGYSGTIMTATYILSNLLGWEYFERLGQQNVMQVQSSTESPKKLAMGERAVQVDGNEYVVTRLKEAGVPLEIVYPEEGTPLVIGNAAIMKNAPHPSAAKLFYAFMFSLEAQQLNSDFGGLRSFHPDVVEREGRTPLSEINLLESRPEDIEPQIRTIKQRYERYFGI